jgi:hypothetical protein
MKVVASGAIMGLSGVPRKHKLAKVYETCFGRAQSRLRWSEHGVS